MDANSLQTQTLMERYVKVVNDAVERHKEEVPYKQLLDLVRSSDADIDAGISIYKNDPAQPHDYFVLGWRGGELCVLEHGKEGRHRWWGMPREHFVEVVEHPDRFIESPVKLNLDWLKRRLGVEGMNPFGSSEETDA